MSLNSFHFILYFFVLFLVLLLIEWGKHIRKQDTGFLGRIQLLMLVVFSYFFIYKSDWRFCICVFAVTVITYVIALAIQKREQKKRLWLITGIVLLLVILGYFKYTNFFLSGFLRLLGTQSKTFTIILPIGISFYTFSALAYLLDVYWKRQDAVTSFLDVLLYISFFPKLTAGPIVRPVKFFPQVRNYRGIKADAFLEGIQIFVFGLFKKIVLADRLGVFVDDVFFAPTAYNTGTVILAVVSYSLQISFDFSGYSDMAIGISKILGFDFDRNFNLPYLANGMSDFWKRWHISLSSWFREYLYFPLGGSRCGKTRTYLNLMIVMTLSGLWHGAGITFVVWGVLHGLACCIDRGLKNKKVPVVLKGMITYITAALLWVVFRAENFGNALAVYKGCFTIHSGISQPYLWSFFAIACFVIATACAVVRSKKRGESCVNGFYPVMDITKLVPLILFFTFCGLTVIMGYFGNTAFIYGRF